jgi:hypothetical protein
VCCVIHGIGAVWLLASASTRLVSQAAHEFKETVLTCAASYICVAVLCQLGNEQHVCLLPLLLLRLLS